MTLVHLNGEFLSPDDARLSAFDATVQHAVGLFETMLAGGPDARVQRLAEHLERIETSAKSLDLLEKLDATVLGDLILETVRRSELVDDGHKARVRLTITGGDLNLREKQASRHTPGVLIVCQPATRYPDTMFNRGVRVTIADLRVNPLDPLSSHKTVNYWSRLREVQAASAKGASEALIFQVTNHLAGGAVSNAFAVKDGRLLTPIARAEEEPGAIASPVLPGITRAAILEYAEELDIPIDKRMLTIDDVLGADELFLTNSSWGVLPVVAVEASIIADAEVGPITRSLLARWREELA